MIKNEVKKEKRRKKRGRAQRTTNMLLINGVCVTSFTGGTEKSKVKTCASQPVTFAVAFAVPLPWVTASSNCASTSFKVLTLDCIVQPSSRVSVIAVARVANATYNENGVKGGGKGRVS